MINLEKINDAIKSSGTSIVCILGINFLLDIEMIILKTHEKEMTFTNSPDFISKVKNYIRKYLKQNMQLNEIMFF